MVGRLRFGSLVALAVLVSVLGSALLLGCQTAAPAKPLSKLTLFMGTVPTFGSLFVAEKKGFWKEQGLDVEVTVFTSGAAATEAFRAGRGNVVNSGDMPSARMWEQGDIVGISPQAHYTDLSVIVARKETNRPSDLKGKKVATRLGSTSEYLLRKYLASEKVDPKEVTILNMDPGDMVIALDKGDIAAYSGFQPFGWQSVETTKDAKIVSTAKGFFTEWMMASTTKEYARTNKDELKAFVAGLHRTSKYMKDNFDDAVGIVAERLKLDKAVAKKNMEPVDWDVTYTPQFRQDMDGLAEFMIDLKALNKKIDWNTAFDPTFLRMVSPDLAK